MGIFSTSVPARRAAQRMIDTAQEAGLLEGAIITDARTAETEKALFVAMLRAVAEHTKEKRGELTQDEIASLFTFVFAKGAEVAANLWEGREYELKLEGMFTGDIPIGAGELLNAYAKELTFAEDCAKEFLALSEEPDFQEPLLSLFEALKWCFRLSFHIFSEYIEDRAAEARNEDKKGN